MPYAPDNRFPVISSGFSISSKRAASMNLVSIATFLSVRPLSFARWAIAEALSYHICLL